MTATRRAVVVGRWSARPDSDFYPWLVEELAQRGASASVLDLPAPDSPTIDAWTAAIAAASPEGAVLLGHSVGCRAILHFLARSPETVRPCAALLVAGWFSVDRPWPAILPWIEVPLDTDRVRAACPNIHVLVSDDDPFTADHRATRERFENELGARVTLVPGARHFNAAEEPAVLEVLLPLLSL